MESRFASLFCGLSRLAEIKGQASKHLRLSPAMHGNVVPAEVQLPGSERSIGLCPCFENVSDYLLQGCLQLGETIAQQQTQVNALGAVVKLAFVNGQAGSSRERHWETIRVEEIAQVVPHSLAQCL